MISKYKNIMIFSLIILLVTISLKIINNFIEYNLLNDLIVIIIFLTSVIGGIKLQPQNIKNNISYFLVLGYIVVPLFIFTCDNFIQSDMFLRLINPLSLAIILLPKTIHSIICLFLLKNNFNYHIKLYIISVIAIIIVNFIVLILGIFMIEKVLVLPFCYCLFVFLEILSISLKPKQITN